MKLPTQLDILNKRIQQRNCEHEWKLLGFNYFPKKESKSYYCFKCKKIEDR